MELNENLKNYNKMFIKKMSVLQMSGGSFIKPSKFWGHVYDPPNSFMRIYAIKPLHLLLRKWYKMKYWLKTKERN